MDLLIETKIKWINPELKQPDNKDSNAQFTREEIILQYCTLNSQMRCQTNNVRDPAAVSCQHSNY